MSKKKPRSKDPHSWIKDTTKKAAKTGAAEAAVADEMAAAPEEAEEVADESGPRRFVIVEYDKNDGHILAAHEVLDEGQGSVVEAPAGVSEGKAASRMALTGDLFDKTLIDLHDNYKVDTSKAKPTLVPKG